jgi:hypothetical protein
MGDGPKRHRLFAAHVDRVDEKILGDDLARPKPIAIPDDGRTNEAPSPVAPKPREVIRFVWTIP